MSNNSIVFVINFFCCFVQRFLPNGARLATYMEIDGITAALSVYPNRVSRRHLRAATA